MSKHLIRKHLGEMPLLQTTIMNLRLREVLVHYVKTHGNETIPAVDTLLLMVCNIACGRQPLYELPHWSGQLEHRALSTLPDDLSDRPFSDDRFGRALDKLFAADRASLVIDIVLRVIEATGVDLSQIHNDSTTVKTTGTMAAKSATGLQFKRGHEPKTIAPTSSKSSITSPSAPMAPSRYTTRRIRAIAPMIPCTLRTGIPCAKSPAVRTSCMWLTAKCAPANNWRTLSVTGGVW